MGQTTISVDEEVADRLYDRKGRGESYNDVILELLERAESGETPAHDDGEPFDNVNLRGDPSTALDDENTESDTEAATLAETIDAVADDVLPGSGSKLDARREAFHAVVEYLREHGEAKTAAFKEDVYAEHPAEYGTPRSWWKNGMYPALAELAERTDAVERADTSGTWRFIDDA